MKRFCSRHITNEGEQNTDTRENLTLKTYRVRVVELAVKGNDKDHIGNTYEENYGGGGVHGDR